MTDQGPRSEMHALRPIISDVVGTLEKSVPYGALLLSYRQGLQILVDNRQQTVSEWNPTAGAVVTAFDGQTMRERAIGGFDKKAILQSARNLAAEGSFPEQRDIELGPERKGDYVTSMKIDPTKMTTQEKLDKLQELHARVSKLDERIVNVRVIYRDVCQYSIFGSRVADLAQDVHRVMVYVYVFTSGEKGIRFDWRSKHASAGWEALVFTDEELQDLVKTAIGLHDADRIEPGEYPVIASPGVAGVICHESFGHGVETDMFIKDRAKAASYVGRSIGSSLVDIWDDPGVEGAFGAYFFDDEGYQAGPTQIVKQGIFKRGITDLYSATMLGLPRSANGRRQDFSRKVYARMSTTFFGRGETPVPDLIKQADNGIYLVKMSSGMEDPKGWGIQVTCHYGKEIKDGKLTDRLFAPVVITGYVPDLLDSVTGVGDDMEIGGGFCGKGHKEYALVSSGGPHMLMKARLG
jgi:TldD protein